MSKVDIPTISSGYVSTTALNTSFNTIEDELNNKVLYRVNPEGEPNHMENDLDMNNHEILNVASGSSPNSLTTRQQVLELIEESVLPVAKYEEFVATNGQTIITLVNEYVVGGNQLSVYLNGIRLQVVKDYVESSPTSIILQYPLVANDNIVVLIGRDLSSSPTTPTTVTNTFNSEAINSFTYIPGTPPYNFTGQTGKYATIVANPNPGSSGTREADFYIKRDSNYSGGTAGSVSSALHVETAVRNSSTNQFEWTTNFTMLSNSNAGENLANATYAFKYGLGAVWGSNILVWDKTGSNAGNGLCALEANMLASGSDQTLTVGGMTGFGSRNVIDIVVGKNAPAEGQCEIGSGIRMIPFSGDLNAVKFRTGIDMAINCTTGINMRGTYTNGIDMSPGSYTNAGLKLGTSTPIMWDDSNNFKTTFNGSNNLIEYKYGASNTIALDPILGNIRIAGFITNISGVTHMANSGGISTTTWSSFTYQNGWVNYGGANNANGGYYIDALGRVHFRGVIKSGTIGTTIAVLPFAFRPQYFVNHPVVCSGGTIGYINIDPTTGAFSLQTGNNTWVSLDGVSYKIDV